MVSESYTLGHFLLSELDDIIDTFMAVSPTNSEVCSHVAMPDLDLIAYSNIFIRS